jgi:hypothetical protein
VQRSELLDDLTVSLRRELEDDLVNLYRDARENARTICAATGSMLRRTLCPPSAATLSSRS